MTWDYSKHFARIHPDEPGHINGLRLALRRWLAPHFPADKTAPMIDVGCGWGHALTTAREAGHTDIFGLDADAGQIARARAAGLPVEHVPDTEAWLMARPGKFACALLLDVLEHVPHERQRGFLQAIAASLRPGGRLVLTVPNAAAGLAPFWLYNDYTHHLAFTADSLVFLLENSGFAPPRVSAVEQLARPRFTFWLPTRRSLSWWLRKKFQLRRRLELMGELGWERGRRIPVTLNLLAVAERA